MILSKRFTKNSRPPQIENLFAKICECILRDHYKQTKHAIQRKSQRQIGLPDVIHVLKNGWHDKKKTTFDETFKTWKYAIRGITLNEFDIRVIVAFDEEDMLIITVMHVL